MLQIPAEIKELFAKDNMSPSTHRKIKLVFYKERKDALYPREDLYPEETLYPAEHKEEDILVVIENDRIESESLVITESLSESENLDFGSCNSAMVEIVVANIEEDLTGKEFDLIIGIGGYDLIFGNYTVKSFLRQADRTKRKITAYDRMAWFDADVSGWYESEKFPMTLKRFRNSLCAFVGIQEEKQNLINDDMVIEKTLEAESLLGINVLRCICQINGVFGNVGKGGKIRYISIPKKEDFQETISTYRVVEYEEYKVPGIDTVKIQKEEGDIGGTSTGGDDVNTYIIEGNFLVYGKTTTEMIKIANNVLSVISNLEYTPATIEVAGLPWIEIGDRVRVRTKGGDVNTVVANRIFTGIQKNMDTIKSVGSSEINRVFNIRSQIIEAKGMSAILKRTVEEVSNHLTDFEKNTESKFIQTAQQIQAEVTRATQAEGTLSGKITIQADRITEEVTRATQAEGTLSGKITIQADRITEEVTRATQAEGTLSGRIDVTEKNISLKVSKGDVSSQLSIESGGIKISGDRFSWSSKNSSMTADGVLSCVNGNFSGIINALNGGKIGGFVIDQDSLVTRVDGIKLDFGDVVIDNTGLLAFNWWLSENEISCMAGIIANDDGDLIVHGSQYYDGKTVAESLDDLRRRIGGGGGGCGSECSGECNQECSCDGDCDETLECDIESGTICVGGG